MTCTGRRIAIKIGCQEAISPTFSSHNQTVEVPALCVALKKKCHLASKRPCQYMSIVEWLEKVNRGDRIFTVGPEWYAACVVARNDKHTNTETHKHTDTQTHTGHMSEHQQFLRTPSPSRAFGAFCGLSPTACAGASSVKRFRSAEHLSARPSADRSIDVHRADERR